MACGCNKCNQRREERTCGCNQRREERTCGCNQFQQYDDFLDIFENEERCTGPYTWNGYVWYDIEVTYNGPFFGSYQRPEPRSCGGRREERSCGCNR